LTGNKSNLDPNTTALAILKVIVESKGSNLYGISKKLKIPNSKISYHMPALLDSGMVVCEDVDDEKIYVPQPILTDAEFTAVVEKAIDEIYAAAGNLPNKVFVHSGKVEDIEAALENCIRARVTLSLCPQ
jgi:predicted transcriptional regulator